MGGRKLGIIVLDIISICQYYRQLVSISKNPVSTRISQRLFFPASNAISHNPFYYF